jgi:hypothetical protein
MEQRAKALNFILASRNVNKINNPQKNLQKAKENIRKSQIVRQLTD